MTFLRKLIWPLIALFGAGALAGIALQRGESINSLWLVTAAVCSYALGYRFYSAFIAAKILALDPQRATPAERLENGRDFMRTNKWVVFGHHFAAIAGPGPLVGPVMAAQFGYLPGTLWIIVGAVFGGCVQDFVTLAFSVRRDGKSLCQMARDEIGKVGGVVAFIAIISIMVVLLGVIGLIVVNALKGSPWGVFTVGSTIPIAMLMGVYLRFLRPGKVFEVSVLGFLLVICAILGGQWVSNTPNVAVWFTLGAPALAIAVILYGFAASVLPVWLLLAPRDYLSTFVKLGTIAILAIGIIVLRPEMHMPALSIFTNGEGPAFAGKIFPFAFITIACGAISGFHSLISSGTTPKMISSEAHIRFVGYGAMMCESFVGVMATIAACVLQPGTYFAINSPAGIVGTTSNAVSQTITAWGYPVTASEIELLARAVGEQTVLNRTGGAPVFALGMAKIFSQAFGGETMMALWYHFALMFEALFILTVLDAGTRVARFMLQEAGGHFFAPLGKTSSYPSIIFTSTLMVGAWGYFLWQGVHDPLGGINSMWPLFGIANQLLATVALCVATTIIFRMGKARYTPITLVPLIILIGVTFSASWFKIFDANPRIGFLAHADSLKAKLPTLTDVKILADTRHLIFNDYLDVAITSIFVSLAAIIVLDGARVWISILMGKQAEGTREVPFVQTQFADNN